ncbi:ketopantoate reductase family protein [Marinobacter sp.]|uniref:ketopantoate reductase family protein n=1 Tax=Marinobacter sp. TaxID=50741 RepID=UPI00384F75FD
MKPPATSEPRCLILGAGSLGRLWAARLPGRWAAFVPREPAMTGYCQYSLITAGDPDRAISVPWYWPDGPVAPKLLLVATKAQDTLPALTGLISDLPWQTPVVLLQNGMGSQDAVAAAWPDRPVLAGSTTEGANRPAADILVHAGKGETWIGGLTEAGHCARPDVIAMLSRTGLVIHPEPQIRQRLLRKMVINAGINPFTAILNCTNGAILDHPFYLENIDGLCGEAAAVTRREGLDLGSGEMRSMIEKVARSTASNTSSMRSDVLKNRPTEIDFINGWIVQHSRALNLHAPVNHMLTEEVKALSSNQ